jgi:hypothetical protein
MKTKGFWVIKTSGGGYWCSGGFDPQIRKAHVYTWKEKAEEAIETFIKRKYFPAEITYEVVAISEPKELKDTEAEWFPHYDEDCGIVHVSYTCSYCGYSALNDYRKSSVASKFCPHCGKYMTNHTQPEDEE